MATEIPPAPQFFCETHPMNLHDTRFQDFALVREMLHTPGIIGRFDFGQAGDAARVIQQTGRLLLTGEGSSRIFPAKNLMYEILRRGIPLSVYTEGARQAHEYNLADFCVFGASNSGQTKELIALFSQLAAAGHAKRFGLTANPNTRLEAISNRCYTLGCGREEAVAATKSVVEQALFYRSLLGPWGNGDSSLLGRQPQAAARAREVLEADLDPAIVAAIASAGVIYFAGRNNGVAEELALKTNEITRKKSDYLEGTYAVHGIEEVMSPCDVVVVVDPFPAEAEKFRQVLVEGVGMKVIALAPQPTIFPTVQVPHVEGYATVLQLLAGWNVLVHVGVALGINLDKPQRARKIGNEFVGP
jgi:glucosamine--fructose-6-phosphate aminotransferase (isomerizing)